MLRLATALLIATVALNALPHTAEAFPQFQKEFAKLYGGKDAENQEYAELVKTAKCFVCHQGKKKKNMNSYGAALEEFIGKPDKKDKEKIIASIEKVNAMHSVKGDDSSPTYGELISAGKLPAGDLEDLKKEPSEEPSEE